ncbi:MAG: hypothetical protein M3342_25225 [Bacteroidota bacterium]|nr:hypothetical protein [Flavisolibacter sp.]MDQ3847290.1 hypothetical protein [Bacteroidota bacterium]
MPKDILEKVLTDILKIYMSYDDSIIDELLLEPNLVSKERVKKINGLEVLIYSHDHNPPHLHVRIKDKK